MWDLSHVSRGLSVTARAEWQRCGEVAVIGSGVMGLATAMQITQKWPNVSVDIISEGTVQDSTSYGSGGALLFHPSV